MRLRKGNKVEVLKMVVDHTESWWCAEIISGNGRSYYVRYFRTLPDGGSYVERVPRKDIRPCPQAARGRLDWVPRDVVEVLDNFSWKIAKISMFVAGESFLVTLLGSLEKITVHSSCIRLRQCWQGNKWVSLGKDSARCDIRSNNMLPKEKLQLFEDQFREKKKKSFENSSQILATNTKKRVRNGPLPFEKCTRAFKRTRTVEKEDCAQTIYDEKLIHYVLINTDSEKNKEIGIQDCDTESVSSSVASCSINKSSFKSNCCRFCITTKHMESSHDLCSTSDSHHDISGTSAVFGRETIIPKNEALNQGPQLEACSECLLPWVQDDDGTCRTLSNWTLLQHF